MGDIIVSIVESKLDPNEILRDSRTTTIRAFADDFRKKGIVCPDCGEICLEWHCTHARLMPDVKAT